MSFVDPGAGGGKNGGGNGGSAGTNIDPNAVGDPNFDPSASTDMGPFGFAGDGGGSTQSGGGRGPDTGVASVASTQLQAPYDIQAGGGLRSSSGGPATDQPQVYKTASAALMGGPQASRTTFGQEAVADDQPTGERTIRPGDPVSYFGHGGTPDAPISSSAWGPDLNTNLGATRGITAPQGSSGGGRIMPVLTPYSEPNTGNVNMPIRTPYQDLNTGSRNMPIPPPPSAQVPTPRPRPAAADAPLPQPRPAGAPGSIPTTVSTPPPATPPAADPAEMATRGQGVPGMGGRGMPQSPLEQIIGQFLQMLGIGGQGGGMGGILSPMEHMLARALGINLQPYPGFNPGFNSPFFQPPGPGQFPAGATGGRAIPPGGSPPGAPPRPAPGPPGSPGNQPSALPPGRRGTQAMSYAPEADTKPWPSDVQGQPDPNMPGQDATKPVPPAHTARGIGATPNQQNRPRFYSGNLSIGGQQFRFGTGGGRYPSLPYGTYYLHPGAIGGPKGIGRKIGSIAGISDSNNPGDNTVNDPTYTGSNGTHARGGVEVHPDVSGGRLHTNGCIGVDRSQWDAFKQAFRAAMSRGPLTLTVRPDGASIQPMGM